MRAVTHRLRVLGEDGVNAIRGHPHVRPVFTEVTRADAIAAGDVFLVPMTVSDDAGNVTCSLTPEQIATNAPIAIMLAEPTETEPGRLTLVAFDPDVHITSPLNWIGQPGANVFIQGPDLEPVNLVLIEAGPDVARTARAAHAKGKDHGHALPAHQQVAAAASLAIPAHTREQQKLAGQTRHFFDDITDFNSAFYPGHDGPEEPPLTQFSMQAAKNRFIQAQLTAEQERIDARTDHLTDVKLTALLTGKWGAGGISILDLPPPSRTKPSTGTTPGDIIANVRHMTKVFTIFYGQEYAAAVTRLADKIQDEASPEDGNSFALIFDHYMNRARSPPSGVHPRQWMVDVLFNIARTDPAVIEFQQRAMQAKIATLESRERASQHHERRGYTSHPYPQGTSRGGLSAPAPSGRGPPPAGRGAGRAPPPRSQPGRGTAPQKDDARKAALKLWHAKRPAWLSYDDKLICAEAARNKVCNRAGCNREHQYNPAYTADQRSEMAAWILAHPNEV